MRLHEHVIADERSTPTWPPMLARSVCASPFDAAIHDATGLAAAGDASLQFAAEPDKGHARHLERFVEQVRTRGPAICGIDDAVRATEVAMAAVHSAREGRIVRFDDLRASD